MRRVLIFCSAWMLALAAAWASDTPATAGSSATADSTQYMTADDLWAHIQELGRQRQASDTTEYLAELQNLHSALLEFQRRFPVDPRRWDVKLVLAQLDSARAQVDNHPVDSAAFVATMKEIINAKDAAPATKTDAHFLIVKTHLDALGSTAGGTNSPARHTVQSDIDELRKDYPDDTRTALVQLEFAGYLKMQDPVSAESIFRDLENSKNLHVAAMAQQEMLALQSTRNLAKQPLDMKFVAVDGSQVDLSKLRGKVVLVDFWATWCGPCRMEIPNVVAVYNQLHKDGFEIVGVSLDQNKDQMLKYTQQIGMTWPQYFDGKAWGNDISTRYGINSIPTAWLVDKKGFVRSTEARGPDLATQVKALLAE